MNHVFKGLNSHRIYGDVIHKSARRPQKKTIIDSVEPTRLLVGFKHGHFLVLVRPFLLLLLDGATNSQPVDRLTFRSCDMAAPPVDLSLSLHNMASCDMAHSCDPLNRYKWDEITPVSEFIYHERSQL